MVTKSHEFLSEQLKSIKEALQDAIHSCVPEDTAIVLDDPFVATNNSVQIVGVTKKHGATYVNFEDEAGEPIEEYVYETDESHDTLLMLHDKLLHNNNTVH